MPDALNEDSYSSEINNVGAVESRRTHEISVVYRLKLLVKRLWQKVIVATSVSLLLLPFLALGVLFADVPVKAFDGWTDVQSLKPGLWLSWGHLFMVMAVFVTVLAARRHGGQAALQALGVAWLLVVMLSVGMLIFLAPSLLPGDQPSGVFVLGFVASWYLSANIAVGIYDITRGSRWWRPPLLAMGFGLTTQALVYFPVVYGAAGGAWPWWMLATIVLYVFLSIGLVGIYQIGRKYLKPKQGRGSVLGAR